MTQQQAYEANMQRAHERLVEARHCLAAAQQQAPTDEREDVQDLAGVVNVATSTIFEYRFR